jgi:hypothetical protein
MVAMPALSKPQLPKLREDTYSTVRKDGLVMQPFQISLSYGQGMQLRTTKFKALLLLVGLTDSRLQKLRINILIE